MHVCYGSDSAVLSLSELLFNQEVNVMAYTECFAEISIPVPNSSSIQPSLWLFWMFACLRVRRLTAQCPHLYEKAHSSRRSLLLVWGRTISLHTTKSSTIQKGISKANKLGCLFKHRDLAGSCFFESLPETCIWSPAAATTFFFQVHLKGWATGLVCVQC